MFEKEAVKYTKERAKELDINDCCLAYYAMQRAYQYGAEFGYNKGYHDAEEHYMNVIDSQHKLVEESKANEWHYVKDEKDLPTDKKEYLLLLGSGIRTFGFYNGRFWESWKGDFSWQEVKAYFFVPVPELKESE